MMRRALIVALLLAGAWGPPPPAEYDRPWTGPGVLHVVPSRPDIVRALCAGAPGAPLALACAIRSGADCWILIARDLDPRRHGALLRHERAHCNGWPASHPRPTRRSTP